MQNKTSVHLWQGAPQSKCNCAIMSAKINKALICQCLAIVATLAACTLWWKHEACYDGGESVSLNSPGRGAFSPHTTEHFDRWAAATGVFSLAIPAWLPIKGANAVSITFLAVCGWALLHTGTTSLAGITCEPHDSKGPQLSYGPGLVAAYCAAIFVATTVSIKT